MQGQGSGTEASQQARNDAIFRDANERIESHVDSMEGAALDGPLPFLCECSDVTCTEIVRMTRAEYEAVRANPTRFATVPGHEGHESWARVVEETDRYAVVEKLGAAADVAIELDPRSER